MAIIKKVLFFILLILIVVGIAVLIWARDESLNQTAARFLQPPIVAEEENAYFYILGFTALPNKKPEEVGKQILMRHQLAKDSNLKKEEGQQIHFSDNSISACSNKEGKNDIDCIIKNRSQIEKSISQNTLFLERYVTLLKYNQFADMASGSVTSISLPFLDLQRAKFALWSKATLLIADNKFSEGLNLLQQDARFWRMLSAQADNLLTRMVAVAMLQKQYEMFSRLIVHFPTLVDKEKEQLLQIAAPLAPQELSFRRALAGEFRIASNTLQQFSNPTPSKKENANRPCVDKNGKPCANEEINFSLENPVWRRTLFYRYHATLNLQANLLEKWADFSEMPAQKIVQQKEPFIKSLEHQYKPPDLSGLKIYNRLGKYLVAAGYFDVSQQIFKIHDLEGLIRLVNIQIQIASLHLTNEKIGPFLQTSDMELMNPYTGDAMVWDEKEKSVYFRALGNGDGDEVAVVIENTTQK